MNFILVIYMYNFILNFVKNLFRIRKREDYDDFELYEVKFEENRDDEYFEFVFLL